MVKVEKRERDSGLEALSPPASRAEILDDAVLSAALALGTPQERDAFNAAGPVILKFAENVVRGEFPHIQPVDRETIAEDSLVNVWRSLSRFNPEYKARNWVSQITRNLAISFLRSKAAASRTVTAGMIVTSASESAAAIDPADPRTPTPLAALIAAETEPLFATLSRRLLAALPPTIKTTAELRLNGVPPKKIAEIEQIPEGTVKSRLFSITKAGRALGKQVP